MPNEMPTPRRRRSDDSVMRTGRMKILLAILGLVTSAGSGYYSGLAAISERVRAAEVRQEVQYDALLRRLDDVKLDINGARAEILNILKERR